MLVSTILFVVTILGGASSIFVFPEKSEGSESEVYYDSPLKAGGSATNQIKEESKTLRSYNKEDGLGKYGNDQQKFSETPKHNCHKTANKEDEKVSNDKADTNGAYEVYYERKLDEPVKEEGDDGTKVSKSEDVKEEEAEEQEDSNDEKEELNEEKEAEEVNDDSVEDDEDDEKNSENYGEAEEDPYKWPFDSDIFEQYKQGFDEFDKHRGFGGFSNGKYGSLGGHSSGFSGGKFGCLAVGNGEYC